MYNNSSTVGNIGETVALAEFAKRGIPVLIPFGHNVPYDLVIQVNSKFYKIQCKTTEKIKRENVMFWNICRTNGFTGEHKNYSNEEIDYICLYCIENDYIGMIKVDEVNVTRGLSLRLDEPKVKLKTMRFAKDYSLDNQLKLLGSLAQSG